ncbi:MAG: hypothetical protein DBX55_09660 [Verrucomicrobia bacterium]|nr:MAG: hypothetical protein DBX55_09660 [Verrucomicrobiota bacterium]
MFADGLCRPAGIGVGLCGVNLKRALCAICPPIAAEVALINFGLLERVRMRLLRAADFLCAPQKLALNAKDFVSRPRGAPLRSGAFEVKARGACTVQMRRRGFQKLTGLFWAGKNLNGGFF